MLVKGKFFSLLSLSQGVCYIERGREGVNPWIFKLGRGLIIIFKKICRNRVLQHRPDGCWEKA